MSVIIALKENGVIYFGADTQATTSSSEKSLAMNDVKFKSPEIRQPDLGGFLRFSRFDRQDRLEKHLLNG